MLCVPNLDCDLLRIHPTTPVLVLRDSRVVHLHAALLLSGRVHRKV